MKTFKYWDSKPSPLSTTGWTQELLFECQAPEILEADKLFMEATGVNPVKAPWIGCTVEVKEE